MMLNTSLVSTYVGEDGVGEELSADGDTVEAGDEHALPHHALPDEKEEEVGDRRRQRPQQPRLPLSDLVQDQEPDGGEADGAGEECHYAESEDVR